MQNLGNLGIKHYQIYVCISDSEQLCLIDGFLLTTDSAEGLFGVVVPKRGKTWI